MIVVRVAPDVPEELLHVARNIDLEYLSEAKQIALLSQLTAFADKYVGSYLKFRETVIENPVLVEMPNGWTQEKIDALNRYVYPQMPAFMRSMLISTIQHWLTDNMPLKQPF